MSEIQSDMTLNVIDKSCISIRRILFKIEFRDINRIIL